MKNKEALNNAYFMIGVLYGMICVHSICVYFNITNWLVLSIPAVVGLIVIIDSSTKISKRYGKI